MIFLAPTVLTVVTLSRPIRATHAPAPERKVVVSETYHQLQSSDPKQKLGVYHMSVYMYIYIYLFIVVPREIGHEIDAE